MELVRILQQLGIDYREHGQHRKSRANWIQICCPYCMHGDFYHGLSIESRASVCWNCGKHRIGETLSRASGKPLREVLKLLGFADRRTAAPSVHTGKYTPPPKIIDLPPAHRRYLESRGFNPDTLAQMWGIRGIGLAARLKWRIWIPICNAKGRPVSWTTRSIAAESSSRYMSADPSEESVSAKSLLYGEQFCKHAVIIHEGPIDVWRTGPGACGTLGLQVTAPQMLKIARYPQRWICFDAEKAAQKRAQALADSLAVFPGETGIVCLETGKDAALADEAEIVELRKLLL